MTDMKAALIALLAGLVFGVGLYVSQMVNPAKVLGFLDVAGNWDPSLAFVMVGAIAVTALGNVLIVTEGEHEFVPQVGDIGDVGARLCWFAGETVAGQGRTDHMKSVSGVTAVASGFR